MFEIQQSRAAGGKSKRKRELKEDLSMAARSNEAVEVVPTLEALPKWERVKEVLKVILQPRVGLRNTFVSCKQRISISGQAWPWCRLSSLTVKNVTVIWRNVTFMFLPAVNGF